jgi:F-type H+-transporting ATPase subunit b
MTLRMRTKNGRGRLILVLTLVLAGLAGPVWAAGGVAWVPTDTHRIINFVVLLILLVVLVRKPIKTALANRIVDIKTQISDLEIKKQQAALKLAEYEKKINTLEVEADQIVAEYVKQGQSAKEQILQAAAQAADKLETQARRNLEQEFNAAKMSLQKDILDKALARAEAMVKKTITPADQNKLVDEFLNKVVVS